MVGAGVFEHHNTVKITSSVSLVRQCRLQLPTQLLTTLKLRLAALEAWEQLVAARMKMLHTTAPLQSSHQCGEQLEML